MAAISLVGWLLLSFLPEKLVVFEATLRDGYKQGLYLSLFATGCILFIIICLQYGISLELVGVNHKILLGVYSLLLIAIGVTIFLKQHRNYPGIYYGMMALLLLFNVATYMSSRLLVPLWGQAHMFFGFLQFLALVGLPFGFYVGFGELCKKYLPAHIDIISKTAAILYLVSAAFVIKALVTIIYGA